MSKAYDIVSENRKQIVDEIIAQMEKGELFWKKNWIEGSLPHNPLTGAVYKGGNRLRLIFLMDAYGYTDARFVTYAQAKKAGWKVKPGSKGIFCEKWTYYKLEEIKDEQTGDVIKKIISYYQHPVVSYFYLYHASSIEGIPPEAAKPPVLNQDENELANMLIRASPCIVREGGMEGAFYNMSQDFIHVPRRDDFKSGQDFITTTLHEMIHSTGHPTRLNRDMSGGFGSESYAKEELVAELGSVFAAADIGIPALGEHFENHAAHLQSWLKALKEDPNELFNAASKAEGAADFITERYKALLPAKMPEVEAQIMAESTGKLKL